MDVDTLSRLWHDYQSRDIDREIHPRDHMYQGSLNGWTDYNNIGISVVRVVHAVLHLAPTKEVRRIMDFACGHGRGARHLRAMFPSAEMVFVDLDSTGAEFCAQRFGGTGIQSYDDLTRVNLPGDMDLIWVGSLFTHLSFDKMITLFNMLIDALRVHGILLATFRGENMYQRMIADHINQRKKYKVLLKQYEVGGVGYQPYNMAEHGDTGLSLSSIERVVGLGTRRKKDVRLVSYTEAGWASSHDVASWTRVDKAHL